LKREFCWKSRRTISHPSSDALNLRQEPPHELFVNSRLDDQARPRHTCLAGRDERRERSAVDRTLQIRIIEDDDGGLSAKLGRIGGKIRAHDLTKGPSRRGSGLYTVNTCW